MNESFREGILGALIDELERATEELAGLVSSLGDEDFVAIRDRRTEDEDCRSIQTVVRHVVLAGYGHANYVRQALGIGGARPDLPLAGRGESVAQLRAMLAYFEQTLAGRWAMSDAENRQVRMTSGWGAVYDLEQMLEHTIVHVLRHRRQIERFLTEPQFRAEPRSSR